ncbi:MAG: hypothetical protein AABY07_10070 [Nanoarchaeota archaeon]
MSNKRGQTTGFVIIGIVILAVIILLLFLRGQFFFGPTEKTLESRMDAVRDHYKSCLNDLVPDYLSRIGLQGGHLKTPGGTFRLREDIPVSYLCYNIPEKATCANRLLTINMMEGELDDAIKQGLATCINVNKFGRGIDLSVGSLNVDVTIGEDVTEVAVNQKVTLRRGDITLSEDQFLEDFEVPLGRLYDVSQDIIDIETTYGEFEQLTYMLAHKGQYIIDKKRPYPDKLYILQTKDNDYVFQFLIQDEPG